MTKYLLPLFVVSSLTSAAELPPSMKFDSRIGDLPPLLFSEGLKQPPLSFSSPVWKAGKGNIEGQASLRSSKRYFSRMPVITPNPMMGKYLPVKKPDPAIDYKIIVKDPDVELRK